MCLNLILQQRPLNPTFSLSPFTYVSIQLMAKLEKPSAIDYLDEVSQQTHTHTHTPT